MSVCLCVVCAHPHFRPFANTDWTLAIKNFKRPPFETQICTAIDVLGRVSLEMKARVTVENNKFMREFSLKNK